MASGSGSYYEDYMRSNALLKHCGGGGENGDPALSARNAKKLLTDRGAYISFLEVQLERVSAACLTTQTFETRLLALESARTASDEKLGSLSKVLRLNQEFIEQNNEQMREQAAIASERIDAWLDKMSTELRAQDARATLIEQQLRRCDEVIQALSNTCSEERERTDSAVDELRTLLFAQDARLEELSHKQSATRDQIAHLHEAATEGASKMMADMKELALVRASLSEKTLQIDQAVASVRRELEQLTITMQDAVDVGVSQACDATSRELSDLRVQLRAQERSCERETSEVKAVLKKCLDTQHMLSATVVAIQTEVDGALQAGRSTSESNMTAVEAAVDELRDNQEMLRSAIRILESCVKDGQQSVKDTIQALVSRVKSTEEVAGELTRESLSNSNDTRQRVVEALDRVEQQIKEDAEFVSKLAVEAVRAELGSHSTRLATFSNTVEQRIRDLERDISTIKELPTSAQFNPSVVASHGLEDSVNPCPPWRKPVLWQSPSNTMNPVNEKYYEQRIQELERQLHQHKQVDEEHRLILNRSPCSRQTSKSGVSSKKSCSSEHRSSNSSSRNSDVVSMNESKRSSTPSESVSDLCKCTKSVKRGVAATTKARTTRSPAETPTTRLKQISNPSRVRASSGVVPKQRPSTR